MTLDDYSPDLMVQQSGCCQEIAQIMSTQVDKAMGGRFMIQMYPNNSEHIQSYECLE